MRNNSLFRLRRANCATVANTRLSAICSPASHLAPNRSLARSGRCEKRPTGSDYATYCYFSRLHSRRSQLRLSDRFQKGGVFTGLALAIGIYVATAVICSRYVYLLHYQVDGCFMTRVLALHFIAIIYVTSFHAVNYGVHTGVHGRSIAEVVQYL